LLKTIIRKKYFFSGLLRGGIRTKTLNRYYIISRYPGAAIEIFGMDETKKAFKIVKSVKKFVLNQII